MCFFSKPKSPEPPPVIAKAPDAPDKAPDPVEIKKDGNTKRLRRKNPLRIDKAASGPPSSGVNI